MRRSPLLLDSWTVRGVDGACGGFLPTAQPAADHQHSPYYYIITIIVTSRTEHFAFFFSPYKKWHPALIKIKTKIIFLYGEAKKKNLV